MDILPSSELSQKNRPYQQPPLMTRVQSPVRQSQDPFYDFTMAFRQCSDLGNPSKGLTRPSCIHMIERTSINCEFYLELLPGSIQIITRLDDNGIWTAHAVRTPEGSRMRTTVLTVTNADSYEEVLNKLHEQSAKDLNVHIRDFGFGLAPKTPDDDDLSDMSGSDDSTLSDSEDEDDKDASVVDIVFGRRKTRTGHPETVKPSVSPAPLRPKGSFGPCGTPPGPIVKDKAPKGLKVNAPPVPTPLLQQSPGRYDVLPPRPVNQATCNGLPRSYNRPLRKPHSVDSMDMPLSAAPIDTSSPIGPPMPKAPRPVPRASGLSNGYGPTPPSENKPNLPFPKPALINVSVDGQLKFTFLDKVIMQRAAIVGAATRAANKRPDVMAKVHMHPGDIWSLQRVRVGEHEIGLNCPIEDLGSVLKGLTGALGTSSEALPCFDVNYLSTRLS